jgi:hypothetical protein
VTDTAHANDARPEDAAATTDGSPANDGATGSPADPQSPPASTAYIAAAGRPAGSGPAPSQTPVDGGAAPRNGDSDKGRAPLFDEGAAGDLRHRWDGIQTGFVDEPRGAVEQADALVAECMQRLADTFARERQGLEQQWSRGDDVSTEDLRLALRRYRSFFDRLLAL